jgi:hypothetical protein
VVVVSREMGRFLAPFSVVYDEARRRTGWIAEQEASGFSGRFLFFPAPAARIDRSQARRSFGPFDRVRFSSGHESSHVLASVSDTARDELVAPMPHSHSSVTTFFDDKETYPWQKDAS